MAGAWRLALPMYNLTPALGLAWQELLRTVMARLRAIGWQGPMEIAEPADLMAFWQADDLLLSQTCGYPLVTALAGHVRVLAVPEFDLPGCEGPLYRSAILVPEQGAQTLEALRGKVAAINQEHSHSGMNTFRHTIAPLAARGRFFGDVLVSGSHMASMAMLQRGQADVAAIDCATLGLARRHAPASVAGLRLLQYTQRAPGLPLIASIRLTDVQAQQLCAVLLDLPSHAPALLDTLSIRRFSALGLADYRPIAQQERFALDLGYPALA